MSALMQAVFDAGDDGDDEDAVFLLLSQQTCRF